MGWFPCSPRDRSTGSVPNYAPAASLRVRRRLSPKPPYRRHLPAREFPTPGWSWVRAATQPTSARFELVDDLEGRSGAGSSRTPFRLACRTHPVWQCRGVPSLSRLLPPSQPISAGQAASSFSRSLRRTTGGVLSSPHGLTAPHGARCPSSTPHSGGWPARSAWGDARATGARRGADHHPGRAPPASGTCCARCTSNAARQAAS